MESQLFDQFLEDNWAAEPCVPKTINTTSDLWPNDLWLNQYNPLAYNFEDFQSLDNQESYFKPENSCPPEFALPSPISDSSSLSGGDDAFDQKPIIDHWVIPTALENASTLSVPCNSPFEEDFPTIKESPSFASSSGSSPSSPAAWEAEQPEREIKTTTKRARKQKRSEKDSTPPCLKRQNSHNLIEKRYRNNLNTKINSLRDSIPSLCSATKEDEDMDSDCEGRKVVQKCNKGIIPDKAIEYIAQLEKEVQRMSKENSGLQLMIKGSLPSYLRLGLRC